MGSVLKDFGLIPRFSDIEKQYQIWIVRLPGRKSLDKISGTERPPDRELAHC